jgi:carbonic anhydrase/acetyltransferase-like protein (isoleucine patch superfamily)
MKIGEVKIGSHVTVHCRSIVLYNAEVADQTLLGPLTLVMKVKNSNSIRLDRFACTTMGGWLIRV